MLADRYGPGGSHLDRRRGTLVDDMEGVGRDGVAVLAGEEGEAVEGVHANVLLHLDEFSEDAAHRPDVDGFAVPLLK